MIATLHGTGGGIGVLAFGFLFACAVMIIATELRWVAMRFSQTKVYDLDAGTVRTVHIIFKPPVFDWADHYDI